MGHRSFVALATVAAVFAGFSTVAFGQAAKKGETGELWETTVRMEMPNMPMAMPAQTHRMCLSKQAGDEKYVPAREGCKVTDLRRAGSTQHFKMVCTGREPMTAEGDVTLAGSGYTGKMRISGRMEGQNVEMTQTYSGKKLGDCTG